MIISFFSCRNTINSVSDYIDIDDLRKHMEYIASDELKGRMSDQKGYYKAAKYCADVFAKHKLEPLCIDSLGNKSYFQNVPMFRRKYGTNNLLEFKSNEEITSHIKNDYNYEILEPGLGTESINFHTPVFIGYGISEPELGWDDLSGLDINGKLVIILPGIPFEDSRLEFPEELRNIYSDKNNAEYRRYVSIVSAGASGIIIIPDENIINQWEQMNVIMNRFAFQPVQTYDPEYPEILLPVIVLNQKLAEQAFKNQSYDPLSGTGEYSCFELQNFEIGLQLDVEKEYFSTPNIISMVTGTDPDLKNFYLTISAHLDHLGFEGDDVYNGANDDASGSVVVLEAAEAIAKNPLKHSVLFILFTAEEAGLLGSSYFVNNLPVSMDKLKVNINLEHLASKHRAIRGMQAIGNPALRKYAVKANKKSSKLRFYYNDAADYYSTYTGGNDNYSFYIKNIPGMVIGTGTFDEYHTPDDTFDLIDYPHLLKAGNLTIQLLFELDEKFK